MPGNMGQTSHLHSLITCDEIAWSNCCGSVNLVGSRPRLSLSENSPSTWALSTLDHRVFSDPLIKSMVIEDMCCAIFFISKLDSCAGTAAFRCAA